jgi:hypothetical protein
MLLPLQAAKVIEIAKKVGRVATPAGLQVSCKTSLQPPRPPRLTLSLIISLPQNRALMLQLEREKQRAAKLQEDLASGAGGSGRPSASGAPSAPPEVTTAARTMFRPGSLAFPVIWQASSVSDRPVARGCSCRRHRRCAKLTRLAARRSWVQAPCSRAPRPQVFIRASEAVVLVVCAGVAQAIEELARAMVEKAAEAAEAAQKEAAAWKERLASTTNRISQMEQKVRNVRPRFRLRRALQTVLRGQPRAASASRLCATPRIIATSLSRGACLCRRPVIAPQVFTLEAENKKLTRALVREVGRER